MLIGCPESLRRRKGSGGLDEEIRCLGFSRSRKGQRFFSTLLSLSLEAQLVKNSPAMRKTWVQSPGWEDLPGEGKGYPFQYPGLENSMDCTVHGVAKSRTRLSDFFHFISNLGHIKHFFLEAGNYSTSRVSFKSVRRIM